MALYILRRILYSVFLVVLVLTLIFFIAKAAPGDPLGTYYSPNVDPGLAPRLRREFGLDGPLAVQYVKWLWNFTRGEFGMSFSAHRPVADLLAERLPRTLLLTAVALALEIILGIVLGVFTAVRRNRLTGKVTTVALLTVYSVPTFYLAYLMISIFSLKLHVLPSANMFSLDAAGAGYPAVLKDRALHLVMPVLVLSLGGAAALARFTRSSLLDVISEAYVTTAKAKGLSPGRIIWLHALRNALAPILTLIGLSFPFLLGGSYVVEKIFAWPGMGALTIDSIFARDYPVILATSFVGALMVIAGNLIADVSYCIADPRIKIASPGAPRARG
jgi:peptide/nickel transport system permease protein